MATATGVLEGCRRRRAVGLGPPEPDAVPHRDASDAGAPATACAVACECDDGGDRWRSCRERDTVGVSAYSGERGPGGVRVSPVAGSTALTCEGRAIGRTLHGGVRVSVDCTASASSVVVTCLPRACSTSVRCRMCAAVAATSCSTSGGGCTLIGRTPKAWQSSYRRVMWLREAASAHELPILM